MTFHLPAIVVDETRANPWFTCVTLCGKKGMIVIREDGHGVGQQIELLSGANECSECSVLWDQREEAGQLRVLWTSNGKRSWKRGGAVLWTERPESFGCLRCKKSVDTSDCLAVAIREVRRARPPVSGP